MDEQDRIAATRLVLERLAPFVGRKITEEAIDEMTAALAGEFSIAPTSEEDLARGVVRLQEPYYFHFTPGMVSLVGNEDEVFSFDFVREIMTPTDEVK